jgi:hypothetical protein
MIDHPLVGGGDPEYSKNYDRIFRKPLKVKLIDKLNSWIIKIFLNGRRKDV